jgi:outer membrane protein assembly factor BamA
MFKNLLYIFLLAVFVLVNAKAFSQTKDTTFVGAQISDEQSITHDFIVGNIRINGNKKTKPQVLLRELLFEVGDSIQASEWAAMRKQSAENLFNTALFNHVGIRTIAKGVGIMDIEITVVERWYIWPVPIFEVDERNFNTWWETRDFSRASAGLYLTHTNFRGRREEVKILVMAGYNQKLGIAYNAPFVNKSKTIGLGFQTIYTLRHEVNYRTSFDKQVYLKLENESIQRDLLSSVHISYRPDYFFTATAQFRYRQFEFADSLMKTNPNYAPATGGDLQYLGINTKFKYDRRDYKSYPLDGYYADLEVRKYGLGMFDNGLNIWNFQTTLRKYWTLSRRWYVAAGFVGKKSAGDQFQPYIFNRSLGYGRDDVRTYQYYVVEGNDFALIKTNIKFALIPPRKVKMSFIKTEKFNTIPYAFYLNLFFDAAYVNAPNSDVSNKLPNRYIYGSGLGLDFVTYYDAVARFEFGVNHMGETGFFLSFIAPI